MQIIFRKYEKSYVLEIICVSTRNIMFGIRDYASLKAKLTQIVKKGAVTRLCRGVYSTFSDDPRLPAAQFMLSPSYIPFETALSYYQMIPERVFAVISAGYELKEEKTGNTKSVSY